MYRPWFPVCNRRLTFADQCICFSAALGEVATFRYHSTCFWRLQDGGKILRFLARVENNGASPSVFYAGTCFVLLNRSACGELRMICRRRASSFQEYMVRLPLPIMACDGAGVDLLVVLMQHLSADGPSIAHTYQAYVYQQQGQERWCALYSTTQNMLSPLAGWVRPKSMWWDGFLGYNPHDFLFFYSAPPAEVTVTGVQRLADSDGLCLNLETKVLHESRGGGRGQRQGQRVETGVFSMASRHAVWVNDSMGVLSVVKSMYARFAFMFSCKPDQYAFIRNVSDARLGWMTACL
jgi:hypothetical protein